MSQKLLIDTDPGNDDATAITLALNSDAYEVVGLTTVPGNTNADNVTKNALSILELLDRTDVPVARGNDRPLCRELDDAEGIHGPGGIRGSLPAPTTSPIDQHAAEFIVDQARTHGEELVIAAVGPMTNLALALHLEPRLPELVDKIYVMGGSAMSGGNTTPEAEFNFFADPEAARHVIHNGTVQMVGLDATNQSAVPLELIESLVDQPEPYPTVASWIAYADEATIRAGLERRPSVHDAVVIADIAHDILTFEAYWLDVGTSDDGFRGAVSCDRRDRSEKVPNTRVAVDIDREEFYDRLRDGLAGL